jgi:RNA polymerase sigma factor (TIGR02999 family)
MTPSGSGVEGEVADVQSGDTQLNKLSQRLYQELHRLAKRHMARQRAGHTLQTTDLLNEAYLKLANLQEPEWKDRLHFLAVASRAMRSVLVDYARRRGYAKRGHNPVRVSLADVDDISEQRGAEVIALDEALNRLAKLDPTKSQIVELRYFGGLSEQEAAEVVGLPYRTAQREWRKARGWLYRELGERTAP